MPRLRARERPAERCRISADTSAEPSRAGYQTWWATSATSSSLRCWVSSLMRFPPMDTGEKPHWVDSPSRSLPTYRAASSMRAMSSGRLDLRELARHQAEHDHFVVGHVGQRLE